MHFSGRTGRPYDWDFVVDGSVMITAIQGAIAVNDAEANVSFALQGLGLAQMNAGVWAVLHRRLRVAAWLGHRRSSSQPVQIRQGAICRRRSIRP